MALPTAAVAAVSAPAWVAGTVSKTAVIERAAKAANGLGMRTGGTSSGKTECACTIRLAAPDPPIPSGDNSGFIA
ncbi:hypothetical protein GCM10023194_54040 [Planotetraspora phitsanulokensis]